MYRGGCVLITAGRGFGQWRRVAANDATTLKLAAPWRVAPDAASEYCVEKFFVENTYFANVNDTPGRLSLWLDSIGCLVDSHRDVFSSGLDVWGSENTTPKAEEHRPGKPNYFPSFYNHFARCWLDGAPVWFFCNAHSDAASRGPVLFGCRMTECMANQAHAVRTGFAVQRAYSGAVSVGGHVPRDLAAPQAERVGLSHTIVANNSLSWTPVGVTVGQFARKTFIVGNTFEGVEQPLLDWGMRTFFLGNARQRLDPQGRRQEPLADVRSERELAPAGTVETPRDADRDGVYAQTRILSLRRDDFHFARRFAERTIRHADAHRFQFFADRIRGVEVLCAVRVLARLDQFCRLGIGRFGAEVHHIKNSIGLSHEVENSPDLVAVQFFAIEESIDLANEGKELSESLGYV